MTQPNENQPTTTFGSLSELESFAQAPSNQPEEQDNTPVAAEGEQQDPENGNYASESDAEEVKVNSNNTTVPTPIITPTIKENTTAEPQKESDKPTEKETTPSSTMATPELEVQLAKDAKEAKERGDVVETQNETLELMKQIAQSSNESSMQVKRIREVLENVVIDPNNIEIASDDGSDPLALHEQVKLLEISRPNPVFPVIMLKSGYKADMGALNNNDKIEMRNVTGSPYDSTSKILSLVYRKMQNTSIGKLPFKRFLAITAEEDYETLLYGIFHSTFPDAIEYSVGCPHCRTENTIKLHPNHLIEVIDRDRTGRYVQEVLEGYDKGEEFLKNSLVALTKRIVLPESKIVIELQTSTLADTLRNLKQVEMLKSYQPEFVVYLKFIRNLYVPDVNALNNGKHRYLPIEDTVGRLDRMINLSSADMKYFRTEFSERLRKYSVSYQIPTFNCANNSCGKEIKDVKIDLTNLLFFGLNGEV